MDPRTWATFYPGVEHVQLLDGHDHLWTEETMRGPLWIELAKQDREVFWRTHENLLAALAKVAADREYRSR